MKAISLHGPWAYYERANAEKDVRIQQLQGEVRGANVCLQLIGTPKQQQQTELVYTSPCMSILSTMGKHVMRPCHACRLRTGGLCALRPKKPWQRRSRGGKTWRIVKFLLSRTSQEQLQTLSIHCKHSWTRRTRSCRNPRRTQPRLPPIHLRTLRACWLTTCCSRVSWAPLWVALHLRLVHGHMLLA
jgi:hypothetical protein